MEYPQEYIYKLFLRKLTDAVSEEEELLIQQVLDKDPRAGVLLDELEAEFLKSNSLAEFFKNIDEEFAIQLPSEEEVLHNQKKPRLSFLKYAAAITILLSIAAAIFIAKRPNTDSSSSKGILLTLTNGEFINLSYLHSGSQKISINNNTIGLATKNNLRLTSMPNSIEDNWGTLQVPNGQTYSLSLLDGTIVHLNSSSTIRFPFSFNNKNREVFVDGELLFSVSADIQKPFIVHTPQGDITVIGTEFNLRTYNSSFTTSLLRGSVVVSHNNKMVILKSGEEAIIDTVKGLTVRKFSLADAKSWLEGKYTFENMSLQEVSGYLSRCYNIAVIFDSRETAIKPFTGNLNIAKHVDSFLVSLKLLDVQFYPQNDTLHFR